ncbi:hypothetical protein [Sphaerobacter sp.]|uniref:hypothetical protein n=1 Tax=Sphaerobacter sp. TaxID=2099654 RepID=UPI001D827B45|nr:hypothetical protein [Sphaerobacter sp.]MBX5446663.1 DUF2637 domain-containing protein [Sphaerobacter sp.]
MTATQVNGYRSDSAEAQRARQWLRQMVEERQPLPAGAAVGRQFGRSERWGRERIREIRHEYGLTDPEDQLPVTPGSEPVHAAPADVAADRQTERQEAAADPGLRDVASTARKVVSSAAIAWLTRDRQERQAGPVPVAAKWAAGSAAFVATAAALVISYVEVAALGRTAGMSGALAWLLPLTADGLLMTGLVTAWVRSRRGDRVGVRPVLALLVGGTATVAANIAARWFGVDTESAQSAQLWSWIPPLIAGYVPVAAALAAEQALALIRGGERR